MPVLRSTALVVLKCIEHLLCAGARIILFNPETILRIFNATL